MTTRNLEIDQWRNREEWRLVSEGRRQLLKNKVREIDRNLYLQPTDIEIKEMQKKTTMAFCRTDLEAIHFSRHVDVVHEPEFNAFLKR